MNGCKEAECKDAIIAVKDDYTMKGHKIEKLVFDHEPGIMTLETMLKQHGIELFLKASRQKAALSKVNIKNFRIKVCKTKAWVREKYNYLPPNQFNMVLCLDCKLN